MAKYKIYRTQGRIDKDIRKHELVAVEEGTDIFTATDAIIHAVVTDLAESEEFSHCRADAYAPEPVEWFRQSSRYDYYVCGLVMPEHAEKNIIMEYGIIEENGENA